jgi:hypothetical protein
MITESLRENRKINPLMIQGLGVFPRETRMKAAVFRKYGPPEVCM